jgi:prolyl-tRNA editing enzyme YbaK/EbsC (Cys-tRNA(Pro) deacylase)
MFGGVEKKRSEPADPKAILTITGSCLFGGIEITS